MRWPLARGVSEDSLLGTIWPSTASARFGFPVTRKSTRAVPVAFSVKEAIYKAIHPFCARYVGFQEVELDLRSLREGAVGVRLLLAPHPFTAGSLEVSARWESATSPSGEPLLIAMARAERRAD